MNHATSFALAIALLSPLTAAAEAAPGEGPSTHGGTLSRKQISKVVRSHLAEVQSCYEQALKTTPGLEGKVVMHFTVGTDGKVSAADASESTLKNPTAEQCMANGVKAWVFPVPKGGEVAVNYPFVFSPSGKPAATPSSAKSQSLSSDEAATFCADQLPKQLACKQEFCTAIVAARLESDPKFQADHKGEARGDLETNCLKEIAVDGTGDLATRKTRCAGWAKQRHQPKMGRAEAEAMSACWTSGSCADQLGCWGPKMAAALAASAKSDGAQKAK